jgi:hypothetical protein
MKNEELIKAKELALENGFELFKDGGKGYEYFIVSKDGVYVNIQQGPYFGLLEILVKIEPCKIYGSCTTVAKDLPSISLEMLNRAVNYGNDIFDNDPYNRYKRFVPKK